MRIKGLLFLVIAAVVLQGCFSELEEERQILLEEKNVKCEIEAQ